MSSLIRFAWSFVLVGLVPASAFAETVQLKHIEKDTASETIKERSYKPWLTFENSRYKLEIPLQVRTRVEGVSAIPVQTGGSNFEQGSLISPRARVGLRYDSKSLHPLWKIRANYEHDLVTGTSVNNDSSVGGDGLPNSQELDHEIRRANVMVAYGPYFNVFGGVETSHWGLGLVANDGDDGWAPGNARFSDPRSGDRVIRGTVGTGPWLEQGVVLRLGMDRVINDDPLLKSNEFDTVSRGDDEATQMIGALMVGYGGPDQAGVYFARRNQTADDGRELTVNAFDLYGKKQIRWKGVGMLEVAGEAAYITGETTLAGLPQFPTQNVQQFGAAARASLNMGRFGAVVDFTYATGDQNPDDDSQNAFRTDPNYNAGMLMFPYVTAAQSGHAVATAGDPELVGVPTDGLERFPTRGAMSNTITAFPRVWYRALDNLEIYGGPQVAFSEVNMIDPLNSRATGGTARNVLDATPGSYMGTEIDVGIRYWELVGTETSLLMAGLEGAMFMPGSAFRNQSGATMKNIYGGRVVLNYSL